MSFSPDGKYFATGSFDKTVQIYTNELKFIKLFLFNGYLDYYHILNKYNSLGILCSIFTKQPIFGHRI